MPDAIDQMPDSLKEIHRAVLDSPAIKSNIKEFLPLWQQHVARVKDSIPNLQVSAAGEIVYLNALSPGCWACKKGEWDCIFVTTQCNLSCKFCLSPKSLPDNYAGSVFGTRPEIIAENQARTAINGISFSGGEPFLEASKLFRWLAWFKKRYPNKYYWVYTNGLLTDGEKIRIISDLGMDEIRFNLAATGYDHPIVMQNLETAVRTVPAVSIEIPVIPEHAPQLLASLNKWNDMGVKYLNLHELMYEQNTNSHTMTGKRKTIVSGDGHSCEINPDSRKATAAIMKEVHRNNLSIGVNDCSYQSKIRQLRGRRQCLSPLVSYPHEKLNQQGFLESLCAYRDDRTYFFHPDLEGTMRQRHPDCQYVRFVRTAPLDLNDLGKWVNFKRI